MTGGDDVGGGDLAGDVARVRTRITGGASPEPTLAVSRAGRPALHAALAVLGPVVEAPALRGRAVWEAAPPADLAVVEQPNWWGRLERDPEGSIRLDAGTGTAVWAVRVREARRIARTLSQLPGVRRAHGDPEAPWFVLLLPVPPAPVIAAMAASGHRGLEPLSPRLAELPGGIRVHPPVSGSDRWLQDAEAIIGGAVRHR